jgi:hypothetical protein
MGGSAFISLNGLEAAPFLNHFMKKLSIRFTEAGVPTPATHRQMQSGTGQRAAN